MKNVILMKNGEEVKCFKIREAFMVDGFRVLIDDYIYGKKNGAMIGDDGKSDRVFETEEAALKRVIDYANKAIKARAIDSYIVREV